MILSGAHKPSVRSRNQTSGKQLGDEDENEDERTCEITVRFELRISLSIQRKNGARSPWF